MSDTPTIRAKLDGFERDPEGEGIFLIFHVPEGSPGRIGALATITFEEATR